MSAYLTGHVKRDPESGAVAVRTIFPDDDPNFANMAWLAATTGTGARNMGTPQVEAWEDLYVPEPPEAAPVGGPPVGGS